MPSDHELVNLSQDYELEYVLKRVGKRTTANNKVVLKVIAHEAKQKKGLLSQALTHKELYNFLQNHLNRLE